MIICCTSRSISSLIKRINKTNVSTVYRWEKKIKHRTFSFLDITLSFLYIQIKRHICSFLTSVYEKPTSSGLFTNFHSFIPLSCKKGLILTLVNSFFRICSTYEHFHLEVEKFRKIFNLNGYPTYFWDKCIQLVLDKIYNPTPSVLKSPKKVIHICLPFIGLHSLQIRTQIQKIYSSTFPHTSERLFKESLHIHQLNLS